MLAFYANHLCNPVWGEQLVFRGDNTISVKMLFQGITQSEARAIWQPLFDQIQTNAGDFGMTEPSVIAIPAQHFWDPTVLRKIPGIVAFDSRRDAPSGNMFWAGDGGQVGQFLHGYHSTWLPQSLLRPEEQPRLVQALFNASRHWDIELHCNKGLAGGATRAIEITRNTAINPLVLESFALAICAGGEDPCYPGISGHEPHVEQARQRRVTLRQASEELRKVVDTVGSYWSESDYFERDWESSYWGSNASRLFAIKQRYDPRGLFTVHHGIGSDPKSHTDHPPNQSES